MSRRIIWYTIYCHWKTCGLYDRNVTGIFEMPVTYLASPISNAAIRSEGFGNPRLGWMRTKDSLVHLGAQANTGRQATTAVGFDRW